MANSVASHSDIFRLVHRVAYIRTQQSMHVAIRVLRIAQPMVGGLGTQLIPLWVTEGFSCATGTERAHAVGFPAGEASA